MHLPAKIFTSLVNYFRLNKNNVGDTLVKEDKEGVLQALRLTAENSFIHYYS